MASKQSAAVALQRAIPENDPAWIAALRAPLDDGPMPEQERLDLLAVWIRDREGSKPRTVDGVQD